MKHSYFEVWNFKGIEHIKLDFNSHPNSNIYTLVGLNESGKTTILEALNFFSYKPETLDPLNLHGYSIKDVHELIPISKRSNFNEEIIIRVGYKFDDEDKNRIRRFLSENLYFDLMREIKDEFHIEIGYRFKNSQLMQSQPRKTWANFDFWGKARRARKETELKGDNWQSLVNFVKTFLPSILYFPNFLFEFPDKIYLESSKVDDEKHAFYRTVLQDVLDATGENTNLTDHVLNRAKDGGWISRNALESVLLKMGSHISRTVFTNWNRIFKRTSGGKEIIVTIGLEDKGDKVTKNTEGEKVIIENKLWYIQLRLKDGSEYYSISDRSLGFRWFFAFLLLTQYRGFRKDAPDNVLFLFDEPASNLHSSAQSQLLESFARFPQNSSIIYTTHSHHMINPAWLEGAFVVKNEGLEYNDNYENYDAANTEITLHKYRDFAVKHPNQTTYFQPVLDVLDYCPSQLENVPDIVMLEGKNDYYTLKYLNDKIFDNKNKINLAPGSGAGSLDTLIRLYLAWGRNFVVLLDSDKGGKTQKDRYEQVFGILVEGKIFSFEDINSSWKKKTMESLFTEAEKIKIQKISYPASSTFNKKHFNRAIQEAYLTNNNITLSKTTKADFEKIIEFCSTNLSK